MVIKQLYEEIIKFKNLFIIIFVYGVSESVCVHVHYYIN